MKRILLSILVIGILLLSACGAPTTAPPPTTTPESYIYTHGIIEVGGVGEPIELINNPNATNPTYAELLAFIKEDPTDRYSYIFGPPKVAYVCSDFAEDVHNNAEAAGIRAAWVAIDFEGDSEGHACVAFETTDIGLVYIDCTGQGLWSESSSNRISWDRRAYVGIGNEYAVVDLEKAWKSAWFSFSVSLGDYRAQGITYTEIMEWLGSHSIEELGLEWMPEWFREHEQEFNKCGQEFEPVIYATVVDINMLPHRVSYTWAVYVDRWDVPWFSPQNEVAWIDKIPVTFEASWMMGNWIEPVGGIVRDVYLQMMGNLIEPIGVVRDVYLHW